MENRFISIRGARQHNLKNISLDIPRDSLVVITGLSGSGKSSLAFDTIYAEGQRRYVESLSAYARQFLENMQKPDVDSIEGLSPAISIEQKTTSKNPRSTVGTVTEIYDYMRLLWARAGIPYSPATGLPITSQTVSQMVDGIMAMPEGRRLYLIAPLVRGRKGEFRKELDAMRQRGFQRVRIDGKLMDIDDAPALNKKLNHDIDIVVDRVVVREGLGQRLADSIETALGISDGLLYAEDADTGVRTTFSSKFACPVSGFIIDEIEPRLFSFNNPFGACPECDGLGYKPSFDLSLVIPDGGLSISEGALVPWEGPFSEYYRQTLESVAGHYHFSTGTPWRDLPEKARNIVLYGSGGAAIPMRVEFGGSVGKIRRKPFEGVINNMDRRWRETESPAIRDELSRYQSSTPCATCKGRRLKPESLAVKVDGLTIADAADLSILGARAWFGGLSARLSPKNREIARRILKEIDERLNFLAGVGLGYLSLSRNSGTLSGGESQRIRLASQIGSGLTGALYVLDEPSIGLHQRDNDRLLSTLRHLRDLGNSVLVVEHDEDAIRAADWIVDMGPGAGVHGGHVVADGPREAVLSNMTSLTAQYLCGLRQIPVPPLRHHAISGKSWLEISGCRANNLQNVSARFPIGAFSCVTGVSGSGKSSLILDTLFPAASRTLMGSREVPGEHDAIAGLEHFDKVIDIDQSPIGRTPRSNPATYIGVFTHIRDWFAGLPEAKARGYGPGRFSFNVKGGRCEACQGDGLIKIEMHFLPDVYVTCDQCGGRRYNRETLEVLYRGKSIADVLDMTVEEAADFFRAVPSIREKMETLARVGLGYLHVGQQATTLSGGEAQRVKLAKELSRRATGRTLYILDEPTTGLHFEDVGKLLAVLHELVDAGNTAIVIEHNLEVIKTADWIVDMGPEGGSGGGEIIAIGPPDAIVAEKKSFTGRYLADYRVRHGKSEKTKKKAGGKK